MSINHVPLPPQPFPSDHAIEVLKAGTVLHRGHAAKYAGDKFVDVPVMFRFSPIWDKGQLIPTWYAGATMECAFYETIFHEAAATPSLPDRYLEWNKLLDRRYSTWTTTRDLRLAIFKAPTLSRYGITIDQLTATDPQYYPKTARWAEAAYEALPALDGIVWNSFRGTGDDAYVLFAPPRTPPMLAAHGAGSVSVIEDEACVDMLNACLDATTMEISGHPDASPAAPIKRVPKKPTTKGV